MIASRGRACVRARVRVCAHAHAHAHGYACVRACMRACVHACVRAWAIHDRPQAGVRSMTAPPPVRSMTAPPPLCVCVCGCMSLSLSLSLYLSLCLRGLGLGRNIHRQREHGRAIVAPGARSSTREQAPAARLRRLLRHNGSDLGGLVGTRIFSFLLQASTDLLPRELGLENAFNESSDMPSSSVGASQVVHVCRHGTALLKEHPPVKEGPNLSTVEPLDCVNIPTLDLELKQHHDFVLGFREQALFLHLL